MTSMLKINVYDFDGVTVIDKFVTQYVNKNIATNLFNNCP